MNTFELEKQLRELSLKLYQAIEEGRINADYNDSFLRTRTYDEDIFMEPNQNITFTMHPCYIPTPEHQHSFIEMIYVFAGECRQIINGKEITMQKGEICILDTNVSHSIHEASEDDLIVNCLMKKSYFDATFLGRLSGNDILSSFFIQSIYQSKDYNEYILFHSKENLKIEQLMNEVLLEYLHPGLCSEEVINSYMVLLFSELLRIYKADMQSQSHYSLRNATITDIILYIQKNYQTATLKSTAAHFHFHPNYLSSVIKKVTGRNFLGILHETKLKNASILLVNSDLSMRDICHEVGYKNVNFFYKLFKNHYGKTPAAYREAHQE